MNDQRFYIKNISITGGFIGGHSDILHPYLPIFNKFVLGVPDGKYNVVVSSNHIYVEGEHGRTMLEFPWGW